MCGLFIWDGVLQPRDPAGTADYFASLDVPVPQIAVWVSIAIHLVSGTAILVGFMTRWGCGLAYPALSGHRLWRASAGR
jgi:uncharacterized membrane protein YphA (DoxX/SURF4 family)